MNPSGVLQRLLEVATTGGNRIPDPGASGTIRVDRQFGCVPIVTGASGETRTLPAPAGPNIFVTLYMATDGGGDCTLTVTGGYDEAGTTTATFSATGQYITFKSVEQTVGTYVWRVESYDGATGPVVDIDTVDVTTLKIGGTTVDATALEINRSSDMSSRIVDATAATLAVTEAAHDGRVIVLDRAAGIAVTLPTPAAGMRFEFIVKTTFTGAASIKSAAGTQIMIGHALMGNDTNDTVVLWQATAANTYDTIDLFGTANSTGGIAGQRIVITGLSTTRWHVEITGDAAGTEATPFADTVA